MTVLGALVFGGLLVLGVLWLMVTAPESDVDYKHVESAWGEHTGVRALTHTSLR